MNYEIKNSYNISILQIQIAIKIKKLYCIVYMCVMTICKKIKFSQLIDKSWVYNSKLFYIKLIGNL